MFSVGREHEEGEKAIDSVKSAELMNGRYSQV